MTEHDEYVDEIRQIKDVINCSSCNCAWITWLPRFNLGCDEDFF